MAYSNLAWQTVAIWNKITLVTPVSLHQIVHLDKNIISLAESIEAWDTAQANNQMSGTGKLIFSHHQSKNKKLKT